MVPNGKADYNPNTQRLNLPAKYYVDVHCGNIEF